MAAAAAPAVAMSNARLNDNEKPEEWEYFNGRNLRKLLSEQLTKRGVRQIVPVHRKTATSSDVNTNQSRLQLPMNGVNDSVLGVMVPAVRTLAEYCEKARSTGNGMSEAPAVNLRAKVLNYRGQVYDMAFRYLNTSKTYRLMGGWNAFVKENDVRPGQILEIWWFDVRELAGDGAADFDVGFAILNYDRIDRNEKECADSLLLLSRGQDEENNITRVH